MLNKSDSGADDVADDMGDGPIDEEIIESAAKSVSDLMPGDFKPMPGLKIPVSAEDGQMVKVILMGKANGGSLTDIYGAECEYEETPKPKGRIKVVLMSGDNEEE